MIPDKAVEALNVTLGWNPTGPLDEVSRRALEAAAPFIRAEALRDEAKRIHRNGLGKPTNDEWFARQWAMQHLARRANDLDPS